MLGFWLHNLELGKDRAPSHYEGVLIENTLVASETCPSAIEK